jgi:protocatechuate 3,4-dioxygenase beta subunit
MRQSRMMLRFVVFLALMVSATGPGALFASDHAPDALAVRAAVALGMRGNPAALVQTMQRPPLGTDPDMALRMRLQQPEGLAQFGANAVLAGPGVLPPGKMTLEQCKARTVSAVVAGAVYDANSQPLPGIQVALIPEASTDPGSDFGLIPFYSFSATTDAQGLFAISCDVPGFYRVMAWDPSSRYLKQYYDHTDDWTQAAVLTVAAGQTLSGLAFNMSPAGSIAGIATDASTGQAVWGLYVYAYSVGGPGLSGGAASLKFAYTDETGAYLLEGLAPGAYEVQIYDIGGFYSGAVYSSPVTIVLGQAAEGVDFALHAATTGMTGTLTSLSGSPVAGAWIWAFTDQRLYSVLGRTDAQGRFRLGVEAGVYALQASEGSGDYLPTYFPGARFLEDADWVTVPQNQVVSGVDFSLLWAGKIAGQLVADADGTPLAGLHVEAFDWYGHWRQTAVTSADGTFLVGGMDPGNYRLWAWDPSSRLADEWYQDKSSYAEADPIATVAGQVTQGILMRMNRSGSLSGYVLDSLSGQPVAGVSLMAWAVSGGSGSGQSVGYATSAADGSFTVMGLATGGYILYAYDFTGRYLPLYYDNAASLENATPLAVTQGSDTSGIRMRISQGGTLAGQVKNAQGGTALPGVLVTAYDTSGTWVGAATTADDGTYAIGGLSSGSCYVFAREPSGVYAPKWYPNAGRIEDAVPVTIVQGSTTGGIDFALPPAGAISGRVTDLNGTPLSNVAVFAARLDTRQAQMEQAAAYTGADGRYTLQGLGTGRYQVGLLLWNGTTFYYPGTLNSDDATPVQVTQGQTTPDIDFSVGTGGVVSGTVTDADTGAPVQYASITVVDGLGLAVSWTSSDADGHYAALWIPTGTYKVHATAQCYKEEWYKNASSFSSARWIHVQDDSVTSFVDFSLTAEGCAR